MSDKKATAPRFQINPGEFCGVFVSKRLGQRMYKMLQRHQDEIKEMLAANIDEVEPKEWTLAFPDGEQTVVNFFDPEATEEEKMRRIELFSKLELLRKVDEVYKAKNMKDAERVYLEYHDKLKDLRQEVEHTLEENSDDDPEEDCNP